MPACPNGAAAPGRPHRGSSCPSATLEALRDLRARLRAYVAGGRADSGIEGSVAIQALPDGTLRLAPRGTGSDWLASAIWAEVLLAQQAGTLRRLKLCRNEGCGSAFYDRSRNLSGVWHDVHSCGNAANLRASRARRKALA
ncbi:MAG: CGNR zinc finger domain-containing protein [Galbitalea sp.]